VAVVVLVAMVVTMVMLPLVVLLEARPLTLMMEPEVALSKICQATVRWSSQKLQVGWFVAKADFAPDMENVTLQQPSAIVRPCSLEMSVRGSIAQASSKPERSALATVCARWAIANVLQAMEWLPSDSWAKNRCRKCAWTRFVQLAVACMGSVSKANVFASRVGKAPIVKIQRVLTIALVTANALSSQSTARASASATMAGVVPVVSGSPSIQRSRLARAIAQEMVCAWTACVHAMSASRVQIAVTSSVQA